MFKDYTTLAEYDEMLQEMLNDPRYSHPRIQEILDDLRYSVSPTKKPSRKVSQKLLTEFYATKRILETASKYPLCDRDNIKFAFVNDGKWYCPVCKCNVYDDYDDGNYIFPKYCSLCGQKIKRGKHDLHRQEKDD